MDVRSIRLAALSLAVSALAVSGAEPIIGLDEIERGMEGEWRTVVSGSEIVTFRLRAVGVAENYSGPGAHVIFCEALDAESVLSGPVAGMSGSPVYLDGRLAGAFAYGFPWPKEQTLIGVQPIERMLAIIDDYGLEPPAPGAGGGSEAGAANASGALAPLAFSAHGFSQETIDAFGDAWARTGAPEIFAESGGGYSGDACEIEPGSAVAVGLIWGDFSMAGTGTATWRDGDRLLAFGHPFLQDGAMEMPMLCAEVLTVARTLPRSFKLARLGRPVGVFRQDRHSGAAGLVGVEPDSIELRIDIRNDAGAEESYSARVAEHPRMTPLLTSMALAESLLSTEASERRQTLYIRGSVKIAGREPIEIDDAAIHHVAAARGFLERFGEVYDNPFEPVEVESIHLNVRRAGDWETVALKSVSIGDSRVKSGETVSVALEIEPRMSARQTLRFSAPIPSTAKKGETLRLLIADAEAAERALHALAEPPTDVDDLIERWRAAPSSRKAYAMLFRKARGLQLEGETLPGLPPSALFTLESPASETVSRSLSEALVWKSALDAPGVFVGSHSVEIIIE